MHKPTTSITHKTHDDETSLPPDFESDHAHFRHLCSEMDGIPTLGGKLFLFRRLRFLLDRMESQIGSPDRKA